MRGPGRLLRLRIFLTRALADVHHADDVWDAMHWEWGNDRIIAARARGAFDGPERFATYRDALARMAGDANREEQ